ncbi:discoidin domain-containing receptor 2 isoform X2, partial [Vespula squamosa]
GQPIPEPINIFISRSGSLFPTISAKFKLQYGDSCHGGVLLERSSLLRDSTSYPRPSPTVITLTLLAGNNNPYTEKEQIFDPAIVATKIRFIPYTSHMRMVCMRVELYGCPWIEGLVSYSMPQGIKRGSEVDLSDRTYDGSEEGGYLSGGLGQLVDGQKGPDNFRLDISGNGKAPASLQAALPVYPLSGYICVFLFTPRDISQRPTSRITPRHCCLSYDPREALELMVDSERRQRRHRKLETIYSWDNIKDGYHSGSGNTGNSSGSSRLYGGLYERWISQSDITHKRRTKDFENIPTKGYEWVGWKNDTPNMLGKPVEITFEFDYSRNFTAIHLHMNNYFTKDVQVFSYAKVYLGVGGNQFNGEPVHFSYIPDLVLEQAREVTIKLHSRAARFLKLQLYFAARWIMLSEVIFESVLSEWNNTDDEEAKNKSSIVLATGSPYQNNEGPLQRDEVKATFNKEENNDNAFPDKKQEPETKQFVGLVIGILTTVIIMLLAAIMFIFYRNRRLKAALAPSTFYDQQADLKTFLANDNHTDQRVQTLNPNANRSDGIVPTSVSLLTIGLDILLYMLYVCA